VTASTNETTSFALDAEEKRIFLRIAEVMFAPMPGGDALAALGPRDLDMGARLDGLVASHPSHAERLAAMLELSLGREQVLALMPMLLTVR
jgi:hypothetical protein